MLNATTEFHLSSSMRVNLDDHRFDTVFEDDELVSIDEFKEDKFINELECDLYAYEE